MTDDQLIIAAKTDPRAAELLIERMDMIIRSATRGLFLPGADHDDMLQEARVGLLRGIRTYNPAVGMPVRRFVWMCVRRELVSRIKKANANKHQPLTRAQRIVRSDDETVEAVEQLPARGPNGGDPADELLAREALHSYALVIRRMTNLERAAVLDFASGLTYQQIAERHGVSVKAIDNARLRAKEKLAA